MTASAKKPSPGRRPFLWYWPRKIRWSRKACIRSRKRKWTVLLSKIHVDYSNT